MRVSGVSVPWCAQSPSAWRFQRSRSGDISVRRAASGVGQGAGAVGARRSALARVSDPAPSTDRRSPFFLSSPGFAGEGMGVRVLAPSRRLRLALLAITQSPGYNPAP